MAKISNELERGASFYQRIFFCPGCKTCHGFRSSEWPEPPGLTEEQKGYFKNNWTWNGSEDKPTFNPSLHVQKQIGENEKGEPIYESICHSWVRDGRIEFLADCKHELKGQVVELDDF